MEVLSPPSGSVRREPQVPLRPGGAGLTPGAVSGSDSSATALAALAANGPPVAEPSRTEPRSQRRPRHQPQPVSSSAQALSGVPIAAAGAGASRSLAFMGTGVMSLGVGLAILAVRPDLLATYHYNQHIIAVTHLVVLGFLASILMGAMYQLVPVALETTLHNGALVRPHFLAHMVGVAGMVATFWVWDMKQVGHFGSLLALGAGCFVYNLVRTLRRAPRWSVVATALASVLGWFSLTLLAGLYLATAKCWDFSPFDPVAAMHAHAHLGVVGVFVLPIVGVSLKLVPMFTLSEVQSPRRAGWAVALINAGLALVVVTVLWRSAMKPAAGLVLVAGLALYGMELRAILRARRRAALDWGLRHFLLALVLLAPVSVLGLVLSWPGLPATQLTTQLENLYGYLGILGVAGVAVMGMLYKIVPFLVWYRAYGDRVGREPVPTLADLVSPMLQAAGFWTIVLCLGLTSAGIVVADEGWVRAGNLVGVASVILMAANLARVAAHLRWPRRTARSGRTP